MQHRTLVPLAALVVAVGLFASAIAPSAADEDRPSWRALVEAIDGLSSAQPSLGQALDADGLVLATRQLNANPAGAVQTIRTIELVFRERMTFPLEATDLETIIEAVGLSGIEAPPLPLSEEDAAVIRGLFEQRLGNAGLDPRFVPDVVAYGAVTGWLVLNDQMREVAYEPTMQAVRDQILLGERVRARLLASEDASRDLRNALLVEVFLIEEADRAARRAKEAPAFREALAERLGPRYRDLRLGPPSGLNFGPNVFEPAE